MCRFLGFGVSLRNSNPNPNPEEIEVEIQFKMKSNLGWNPVQIDGVRTVQEECEAARQNERNESVLAV